MEKKPPKYSINKPFFSFFLENIWVKNVLEQKNIQNY